MALLLWMVPTNRTIDVGPMVAASGFGWHNHHVRISGVLHGVPARSCSWNFACPSGICDRSRVDPRSTDTGVSPAACQHRMVVVCDDYRGSYLWCVCAAHG